MMQINIGTGKTRPWNKEKYRFAYPNDPPEEVVDGYTGRELVQDRKNCIRAGLHMLHGSRCGGPVQDWLRAYASGSCSKGAEASARRMKLAIWWFSHNRPKFNDVEVINPSIENDIEKERQEVIARFGWLGEAIAQLIKGKSDAEQTGNF